MLLQLLGPSLYFQMTKLLFVEFITTYIILCLRFTVLFFKKEDSVAR